MAKPPSGPLAGVRVIEIAGYGALPFGAMLLADLGAEVTRVDRVTVLENGYPFNPLDDPGTMRGRRSVAVNLKDPRGIEVVLDMVRQADVLLEAFRPGVAERMGIGPEACHAVNPGLIYGRVTGWGRNGPLSGTAGHDMTYIALSGTLATIGTAGEPPVPPVNILGNLAGGGTFLALGVLAALHHRERTGEGQVVDAAMLDGAAMFNVQHYGLKALGAWPGGRGENFMDTGAHFENVYRCADGKFMAIATSEWYFYDVLLECMGLAGEDLPGQWDRASWPAMKQKFADIFATHSRDEWVARFAGTDACAAPVLEPDEAPSHPHNVARGVFVDVDGVTLPAPAPRFDRTPLAVPTPAPPLGVHTREVLAEYGIVGARLEALFAEGVCVERTGKSDLPQQSRARVS